MEIEAPLRTTGRDGRNTPAYPPDERRQSVVGSTEDAWRASQAWHRCRPDQLGQVYGAEEGSSWQSPYSERLIGSIRRECLDHIVVSGERHLRHGLLSYMDYYNGARPHLSLNKDAPISRAAEAAGRILSRPILGGLHHQYARA